MMSSPNCLIQIVEGLNSAQKNLDINLILLQLIKYTMIYTGGGLPRCVYGSKK